MQQSDKINSYLETVRQQIRWKRAQPIALEEIKNHIIDQKNALLMGGLDEETATNKAIAEMGDPVAIGEQLDRAHRPRPDWTLLVLTGTMLLLGLAIQFFVNRTPNDIQGFETQIIWAGMAAILMTAAYFADFTIVGKYPKSVFGVLALITVIFCLFTGKVAGMARNAVYPLLLFPTAFAGLVYSMRNKGYGGLVLCGVAFLLPAVLSSMVPSITVLFLLCVSCLIILTAAVLKGWFKVRKLSAMLIIYVPTAFVLLIIPFIMIMAGGYRAHRLQCLLNPSLDPMGAGYMGTIIRRILSNAQFIGEGVPINGYGLPDAFLFLPEINTDYLLTYLIYRFGWIVLLAVILLFAAFIVRGVVLCGKQKNILGFLTSTAIVSTIAVQLIVYISSNLGFLLFSPLSLPLISYGGKFLMINMFLIGLLLSVFRTGALVKDKAGFASVNPHHFIQYNSGQIIINLRSRK